MIRVWLFLHLLGFVMWLGGGLAGMVIGIRGRREDRAHAAAIARLQAALHKVLISPGAVLTVLSGLVLTFKVYPGADNALAEVGANHWLILMQAAGLIAALLTLLIGLPTVSRLARIEPTGDTAALFDELRQRNALVSSISGTLGLVALIAGAMLHR